MNKLNLSRNSLVARVILVAMAALVVCIAAYAGVESPQPAPAQEPTPAKVVPCGLQSPGEEAPFLFDTDPCPPEPPYGGSCGPCDQSPDCLGCCFDRFSYCTDQCDGSDPNCFAQCREESRACRSECPI